MRITSLSVLVPCCACLIYVVIWVFLEVIEFFLDLVQVIFAFEYERPSHYPVLLLKGIYLGGNSTLKPSNLAHKLFAFGLRIVAFPLYNKGKFVSF
jgi:hypothetical protein